MLTAQSPVAGIQKLRPKSGRKPLLQIKNTLANIPIHDGGGAKSKPSEEKEWTETSPIVNVANKENNYEINVTPTPVKEVVLADASLAEELSAIRKKLERMRLDKEKTEEMLKERDVALGCRMKEVEHRGEVQKVLEIEVDRLFRLKELKFMRVSPIRSLREKEGEKKTRGTQLQVHTQLPSFQRTEKLERGCAMDVKAEEMEESIDDESALRSPISESSGEITEE